jgi:DUF971 family protein
MTTSSSESLWPVALKKEGDDRLIIEWNDGHRSVYTWQHLRVNCPCAGCREDRQRPPDPFRILKPSEIPHGPLKPVAVKPVGRYAYQIAWNDGHDTGIYSFDVLRELCQCEECRRSV